MYKLICTFLLMPTICLGLEWKSVNHPDFDIHNECIFHDKTYNLIRLCIPSIYINYMEDMGHSPIKIDWWLDMKDLPQIPD